MKDIMLQKGRIFDIQKYSVHDGPGIRTIVFLKGCPLRCKWCCNPESQSRAIQTMIVAGEEKVMGQDVTVEEVMEEVLKDMPHFRRSHGGLTLSGGECLMQSEFSSALLQAAHAYGITTAIETTAYASFEMIEDMMDDGKELISIYYGAEITEEAAEELRVKVEANYPKFDVELQYGGQPIYYYIVSAE